MSKIIESPCGNTTVLAGGDVREEFFLDDSARDRVRSLLSEKNPGTFLRIEVRGGGCSGFRNDFSFDQTREDDDYVVIENESPLVVIDSVSMGVLKGSTLRYIRELGGEFFQIENPHAKSSCGCGKSYSV